jgi:hypothetical protein
MPRVNSGTLLENIVVLEATRLYLDTSSEGEPLAFASAFAMPALTQCWSKAGDIGRDAFDLSYLQQMAARPHPPQTLQDLWSRCIINRPQFPIQSNRDLHGGEVTAKFGGPNGALLASMLAAQRGRRIHVWVNDDGGRYGAAAPTAVQDIVVQAGVLVGAHGAGDTEVVSGTFPRTLPHLAEWFLRPEVQSARVRIGLLDPDNYVEGVTTVSRDNHTHWLEALALTCDHALSILFGACRNHGTANRNWHPRLRGFHEDAVRFFPQSLVFECGGLHYWTGVKLRWPDQSILETLREAVERVWHSCTKARLTIHVNGQPGR